MRRLVSASTILRSCAIRWAASALAICSWVGVGSSPYGRQQPGQQLALQFVERHRLERLIRRVRRPAAGGVLAVLPRRSGRSSPPAARPWSARSSFSASRSSSICAHRLDVLGGSRHVLSGRSSDVVVSSNDRPRAQRGGEPQVEHRVVGVAVVGAAQHRAGDALPQHLAVAQAEHRHHPAGVDGLRRTDRDALPAQRFDELDQVTRECRAAPAAAAGGCGGRPSVQPQLPGGLDLVGLVLEHHTEGRGDGRVARWCPGPAPAACGPSRWSRPPTAAS